MACAMILVQCVSIFFLKIFLLILQFFGFKLSDLKIFLKLILMIDYDFILFFRTC